MIQISKIITLLLLTTLAIGLVSCGESNDLEEKARVAEFKRVVGIHDEVMPIWGKMPTLRKNLKAMQDELKNNSDIDSDEQIAKVEAVREDLKKGYDDMRTWMKGVPEFRDKPEGMTQEAYFERMKKAEDEIIRVKALMESSVEEATALLKK